MSGYCSIAGPKSNVFSLKCTSTKPSCIPAFKNAEAYIGVIALFFGSSAKRQRLLDTAVDKMTTPTSLWIHVVCVGYNV